ncbi:MAG: CarD family transcriptional regulator [Eubacteriales bacterium]|nr:CarD family transcriptional regulator [Eubacteriales bacterium]
MFEVGDKVMYGVVGVCIVEKIAKPPIKGIDGDYYYLQPVYDSKGLIYSPVNSNKVTIREIITKKQAEKYVDKAINCKKDEMLNGEITPNQYDVMIKSQDIMELMHLIRGLYNIKNERAKDLRKMKSADSRMLTAARKLLYGELAVSLDMDYEEITQQLDEYLGQL